MKIIVKKLQGGECSLDVSPETSITEIKREIAEKLGIPVEHQKLLLMGRTLSDDQKVKSYPSIKDGSKLNLVVKKPEGFFEALVKYFKSQGKSEQEAANAARRTIKNVDEKIKRMSWDDIDRLALDCLLDERGVQLHQFEEVVEYGDLYTM